MSNLERLLNAPPGKVAVAMVECLRNLSVPVPRTNSTIPDTHERVKMVKLATKIAELILGKAA